jgi:ribosomal protein S18 acetylase RimI-like enzyme
MRLREISGPPDSQILSGFDASYSTGTVYRISVNDMDVTIREEKLASPVNRLYAPKDIEESLLDASQTIIAEVDGRVAGFAAFKFEEWNKRAVIIGIYVMPEHKGRGIGSSLVKRGVEYAKTAGARCLWLETQNINYPAIQFYLRSGFRFCGFDTSLYDPAAVMPYETALFFSMDITQN